MSWLLVKSNIWNSVDHFRDLGFDVLERLTQDELADDNEGLMRIYFVGHFLMNHEFDPKETDFASYRYVPLIYFEKATLCSKVLVMFVATLTSHQSKRDFFVDPAIKSIC